ncbi:MAG: ribosome-associated translation inhibitor RaiA [Deltaproteobacteria bacterium]|nr:ribosome-associated translation inhibitor RaiA [Deltaproteobacteria bacterium]
MDITVTFRHVDSTESLKEYAEEKISKIDKYFDYPVEAHIVLTAEKFRRMADVTLNVNGAVIKAEEETEDMYSAIDQVMDKIEIQVKRYRDKIRNKRGKSDSPLGIGQTDEAFESGVDEPGLIVEKLVAKPMDPEEAAMQFTISQQDFLVFRNSRSGDINVIYKRKDGNLGVIEPAA